MCDCFNIAKEQIPSEPEEKTKQAFELPETNGVNLKRYKRIIAPVRDSYLTDKSFREKLLKNRNRIKHTTDPIKPEVNGYIRIDRSTYLDIS